jgi:hypothetical protein
MIAAHRHDRIIKPFGVGIHGSTRGPVRDPVV